MRELSRQVAASVGQGGTSPLMRQEFWGSVWFGGAQQLQSLPESCKQGRWKMAETGFCFSFVSSHVREFILVKEKETHLAV